jgi:glycerophosphoryl diester phosphodiesterase
MDTIKVNSLNTKMVAHRGVSGIELENTNAAFIAAGNRSYFGIETDVHKTADGRFVVHHDDNTGRLCDVDVIVEETPFDTLRGLHLKDKYGDATRADTLIPTLKEYIATCKRYDKIAVLELKNEFTKEEINAICDEILSLEYLDKVIFISFCFANMVRLRELYPNQEAQFLTSKYQDDLPQILGTHGLDIDILYSELNEERIQKFHASGVKVNCWTCDDKDFAESLAKWGIDFITSNILE